jgi:hypothetical protein
MVSTEMLTTEEQRGELSKSMKHLGKTPPFVCI